VLHQDAGQAPEAGVNGGPAHISCSVRVAGSRSRHLVVGGEVDLASAPAMGHLLSSHLDGLPPGGELVVDMSEVGFLSAAGLHVLVTVARTARERRVVVRLDPVSDLVDRLLEISRVWREVERGPGAVDVAGPGWGSRGRLDPTVG
jgi:anti-anti-sigma factor